MSIFDKFIEKIREGLKDDIKDLMKSEADSLPEKPQETTEHQQAVAEKAILSDPYFEYATQHFIQRSKMSRISNKTLKDVSLRDWLVSAIIQCRLDTVLRFSRPEHRRFEMGFQFVKRNPDEGYTEEDHHNCRMLEDFIYHCGRTEKILPGREMLFGEFLKLTLRDAMTFGHVAIEKVLTRKGALHHFRPVPGESVYRINQKTSRSLIEREVEAARRHYAERLKGLTNDPSAFTEPAPRDITYYKYVQMSYDGRVLSAFGDEDMVFKLFNPQNFPDSQGYCYLPKTAYVTMGDHSLKLIEDISVGEMVRTPSGASRKVTDKKQRLVDEDVYEIAGYGMMPHVVTAEHPLRIVRKGNALSFKGGYRESVEQQWVPAAAVKAGDFLCVPKHKLPETLTTWRTEKYGTVVGDRVCSSERACNARLQSSLPVEIPIDADFGWLLGVYLGDGYCTQDTVSIALSLDEDYIVERLMRVYDRLGLSASVYKYSSHQTVNVCSRIFVRLIQDLCPGKSRDKRVNPCLYSMPAAAKLGLILGHIEADGYHAKSGNVTASTASLQLASDLATLMNSLGFLAKVQQKRSRAGGSGFHTDLSHTYSVFYPTVFDKLGVATIKGRPVRSIKNKRYFEDDQCFYVSIASVRQRRYSGPVYNIEVEEEHCYLVNQAATHNCYGPLELAIINITNHLNVENYNANFFTHGFAARGILHLKGTVTQSQLAAFRRQFYNSIMGTQHAWRTPIISGLDDVQWIQMSGSAREMEYINFNHHLMRTICTQFQIDPIELGLDFLTSPSGRASMQQANNEYKINYSRERGLFPILMFYEDLINCDIIPALDKELASKYVFKFTGYTDETPQTSAALLQAEMTVYRSMNDLLREAKKQPIDHPIADLPLNQAFWAIVEKNMTRGEIRSLFLGDREALDKPELAYIPADPAFLAWQQLLITKNRLNKQDKIQQQQMAIQQQQQEQEAKLVEAAHGREQARHDAEMAEVKSRQAHAAVTSTPSVKDVAKEVGAASKALEVGGTPTANPINVLGDK